MGENENRWNQVVNPGEVVKAAVIGAWQGDLQEVKSAFSLGMPVDSRNSMGNSVLNDAVGGNGKVHEGHVSVVRFSVLMGARTDVANKEGKNALDIAIEKWKGSGERDSLIDGPRSKMLKMVVEATTANRGDYAPEHVKKAESARSEMGRIAWRRLEIMDSMTLGNGVGTLPKGKGSPVGVNRSNARKPSHWMAAGRV